MPRIKWDGDEMDELPQVEVIRRNADPISGRHDLQRRSEDQINRARRQERKTKEKNK